jgi:hypothetical protein
MRFGAKNGVWVEKTKEAMRPREIEVLSKEAEVLDL